MKLEMKEGLIKKTKAWGKKAFDIQSRILIRNSSWVFSENLTRTSLNFIRAIVIARVLGAELYGTYAMVVAFCMTVQEFFNLNLGTTVVKFGAEFKAEQRKDRLLSLIKAAFFTTLITAIISILTIFLLICFSYETFVKKPNLGIFVVGYAIAWSTNYFDFISSSILRLFFKFKLNSLIRIIMSFIEFVLIICAILVFKRNLGMFFLAVIGARLINSAIINIAAYIELKGEFKDVSGREKLKDIRSHWKRIRNFTVNNSLSRTVFNLINQGDILLVGMLTNVQQAGYYAIAKKLAFSILMLSNPFANAVFPQFSKLIAEKRKKEIKTMIVKIEKIIGSPVLLSLTAVFFFRKDIIKLIFGPEYIPAADIFFILMIVAAIVAVSFWNLPLIQSIGKVGFRLKIYIIALVVEVIISVVLYPYLEALGISIAVLTAFGLINGFFALENFRYLKKA